MNILSDGLRVARAVDHARVDQLRQLGQQKAAQMQAQVAVREPAALVRQREPVDGDQVLRWLYTYLRRFACWGSEDEVVTSALWACATWARDGEGMPVWQYAPRLGIFGPSGSGKSWKARLIGKVSYKPEILVEPTKPAFIDLCADQNTVILTEADEAFRSPGRSRGILSVANASYEPDRSASRKRGGVAVKIPIFTFILLDGIDTLLSANRPDLKAMISRTLVLRSVRPAGDYRPPRFDGQAREIAGRLARVTGAWMAQEVADGMGDDIPSVPDHLGGRPYSLWEPLFVVSARADACWRRREHIEDDGTEGPWTAACRAACERLESQAAGQDEDMLSDLDQVMSEWGA